MGVSIVRQRRRLVRVLAEGSRGQTAQAATTAERDHNREAEKEIRTRNRRWQQGGRCRNTSCIGFDELDGAAQPSSHVAISRVMAS